MQTVGAPTSVPSRVSLLSHPSQLLPGPADASTMQTMGAPTSVTSCVSLLSHPSELLPGTTGQSWHQKLSSTCELAAESHCNSLASMTANFAQRVTGRGSDLHERFSPLSAGPTHECVDCRDVEKSSFDGLAEVVDGE